MAQTIGDAAKSEQSQPHPNDHNGEPVDVTAGVFLTYIRNMAGIQQEADAINARRKMLRKQAKANGITLGAADEMVKIAAWDRQEVRDYFSTRALYAGFLGLPVENAARPINQAEFAGLDDAEIMRREAVAAGRTAARTGRPGKPPEEMAAELHQAFMQGFHEEDEKSWDEAATPAAKQQDADKPAAPAATQPETPTEPSQADAMAAALVADNAKGTFDQPSWKGFSDNPADWFAQQKTVFHTWYEGLPDDAEPLISHAGVQAMFTKTREAKIEAGVRKGLGMAPSETVAVGPETAAAAARPKRAPRVSPGDAGTRKPKTPPVVAAGKAKSARKPKTTARTTH